MGKDRDDDAGVSMPASLLPYDIWVQEAYREVMLQALLHASVNGLPGDHHFYVTFLTAYPEVDLPERLRLQYPDEMTIVLQNQFWGLTIDRLGKKFSVGLSFGGVGTTLTIPFAAISAFADPHAHVALNFKVQLPPETEQALSCDEKEASKEEDASTPQDAQVVRLDAFRKRPTT